MESCTVADVSEYGGGLLADIVLVMKESALPRKDQDVFIKNTFRNTLSIRKFRKRNIMLNRDSISVVFKQQDEVEPVITGRPLIEEYPLDETLMKSLLEKGNDDDKKLLVPEVVDTRIDSTPPTTANYPIPSVTYGTQIDDDSSAASADSPEEIVVYIAVSEPVTDTQQAISQPTQQTTQETIIIPDLDIIFEDPSADDSSSDINSEGRYVLTDYTEQSDVVHEVKADGPTDSIYVLVEPTTTPFIQPEKPYEAPVGTIVSTKEESLPEWVTQSAISEVEPTVRPIVLSPIMSPVLTPVLSPIPVATTKLPDTTESTKLPKQIKQRMQPVKSATTTEPASESALLLAGNDNYLPWIVGFSVILVVLLGILPDNSV